MGENAGSTNNTGTSSGGQPSPTFTATAIDDLINASSSENVLNGTEIEPPSAFDVDEYNNNINSSLGGVGGTSTDNTSNSSMNDGTKS